MELKKEMDISTARDRVKNALTATSKWRVVAREDYAFVQGKQWSNSDLKAMKKNSRPAITVNRCRPIINLLCGYASQNDTEPDFLPRSEEDDNVSRVAKGVTKYALDKTNYQRVKKTVFKDKIIAGVGYFWTSYDFDYDKLEGTIKIDRVSPFDVFIDPECDNDDLSDAEFCGRYSWETPAKLAQIYTDKADDIKNLTHKFDDSELETVNSEPLWYSKDLKKVRVVQYWYKKYGTRKVYETADGLVPLEDAKKNPEQFITLVMSGAKARDVPDTKIRYATFAGDVLLEEGDSPYKHKRFPLVRDLCYCTGEKADDDDYLEPAGIIRDIKDPQRELNKNRSQRMHVVNQQALGVRMWTGPVDDQTKRDIKSSITTPGANIFLPPGVSYQDGAPAAQSVVNMELESQANSDFYSISGITPESLSGSVGAMSGKAIDLRQSVTTVQTADIFDKSKEAERLIVQILWGESGKPGLIPQFYNEKKVLRILGKDGNKEFIQIQPGLGQAAQKQPVLDQMGNQAVDGDGNPITKALYDLSLFDFDIVITTSTASATARRANLYQLLEAKKSGVDIPIDIILDFMDFPEKEEVKKRMKDASNQPKAPDITFNSSVKDLPADALSTALQSMGVNIPAEKIMQERLELSGKIPVSPMPLAPQPAPTAPQGMQQQVIAPQPLQQMQQQPQGMPPGIPQQ